MEYDFIEDVFETVSKKWIELDDQQQEEEEEIEFSKDNLRSSTEYVFEFLETLSSFVDIGRYDVSLIIHVLHFIINDFKYMDDLMKSLYDEFGEIGFDLVTEENIEEYDKDALEERTKIIGDTVLLYIKKYLMENQTEVQYVLDSLLIIKHAFYLVIQILLVVDFEVFGLPE
jgi:hypothetical protein